jgi:hypothetical protein
MDADRVDALDSSNLQDSKPETRFLRENGFLLQVRAAVPGETRFLAESGFLLRGLVVQVWYNLCPEVTV